MTPGTCAHFNGIPIGDRAKCCEAGVNYIATFGAEAGIALRMPCIQFRTLPAHGRGTFIRAGEPTVRKEIDRRDQAMIPCPLYREPTAEEIAQDQADWAAVMNRMLIVGPIVSEWRKKPPIGKAEVIECPVCKGRLHLSQARVNGHVHGRCETAGCVSWME